MEVSPKMPKTFTDTTLNFTQFSHTWRIQNFKTCYRKENRLKSSTFYSPLDDKTEWNLVLYTDEHQVEHVDYLLLRFQCQADGKAVMDLKGKIKFGIINKAGKKSMNFGVDNCRPQPLQFGWYLIRISELLDKPDLLPDDVLTINCEILIYSDVIETVAKLEESKEPPQPIQFAKYIFNDTKFTDVILCSTDRKEFKAHKCVLAAASTVFDAMFTLDMREKRTNRVDIQDTEPEVIEEMIRFIYTGDSPKIKDMADKLLVVADKYDLCNLKETCEHHLGSKLSIDTGLSTLILADKYSANGLKKRAAEFIADHYDVISKTPEWEPVLKNDPALLISVMPFLKKNN